MNRELERRKRIEDLIREMGYEPRENTVNRAIEILPKIGSMYYKQYLSTIKSLQEEGYKLKKLVHQLNLATGIRSWKIYCAYHKENLEKSLN